MAPSSPAPFRAALPYFGSVLLWKCALHSGRVLFRQNEHYQRRTQRNRTVIANSQGRQTLSIPLLGGKHQRCPMPEVGLSYAEDWQRQHWLSLTAAYASAPYWAEYQNGLSALYKSTPATLWAWNLSTVHWANTELGLPVILGETSDWIPELDQQTIPLTPSATLSPYPQVFSERTGWLSNLSILDLLLCQGPAATGYLARSQP